MGRSSKKKLSTEFHNCPVRKVGDNKSLNCTQPFLEWALLLHVNISRILSVNAKQKIMVISCNFLSWRKLLHALADSNPVPAQSALPFIPIYFCKMFQTMQTLNLSVCHMLTYFAWVYLSISSFKNSRKRQSRAKRKLFLTTPWNEVFWQSPTRILEGRFTEQPDEPFVHHNGQQIFFIVIHKKIKWITKHHRRSFLLFKFAAELTWIPMWHSPKEAQ